MRSARAKNTAPPPRNGSQYSLNVRGNHREISGTRARLPPAHFRNGAGGFLGDVANISPVRPGSDASALLMPVDSLRARIPASPAPAYCTACLELIPILLRGISPRSGTAQELHTRIARIPARRMINSRGNGRGPVDELAVTSYPLPGVE